MLEQSITVYKTFIYMGAASAVLFGGQLLPDGILASPLLSTLAQWVFMGGVGFCVYTVPKLHLHANMEQSVHTLQQVCLSFSIPFFIMSCAIRWYQSKYGGAAYAAVDPLSDTVFATTIVVVIVLIAATVLIVAGRIAGATHFR